ncbi:TPA: hypothetical protein MI361_10970 [Klebsiella pneumoniae]|nr:hypothetical protein [Klebsiella pneumoniae]
MAGGFIPYHLRHNKSIDREVFLEGLSLLSKKIDVKEYTYIGFGGPMLEDFRIMHSRTSLSNLISLEEEEPVHIRQKYNLPYNCIECKLKSAHDFIIDHNFLTPSIVWLDYASAKKILGDLDDIQLLCKKVNSYDILKVTFPINPASYYQRKIGESISIYKNNFLKALKTMLSKAYLDFDLEISDTDLSDKKITQLLIKIITNAFKISLERGLTSRRDQMKFHHLTINKYNDGSHTMLTIFGVFLKDEEYQELNETCNLETWNFYSKNWQDIQEIAIPTLTIKEKINLDSALPDKESYLAAANEFALSKHDSESYFKYYRLYPNFQRVIV